MKQLLYKGSLTALMVYTFAAQAYTFTVKNFTDKKLDLMIVLKGPGNITETASVEPHPIHQGLLGKAFSQVKQWASQAQQEVSNKLADISNNLMSSSDSDLGLKLANFRDDLSDKANRQVLKAGAKNWVVELDKLRSELNKAGRQFDRDKLKKKLAQLSSEMSNLVNNANQEPNTAVFSFTGFKVGLCVKQIFANAAELPIYGLDSNQYNSAHKHLANNDYTNFASTIAKNIQGDFYTKMSKSLLGVCFSRQFDIVKLPSDELVIITKEML